MKMMLPNKSVRTKILNDLIQIHKEQKDPGYCYTWEWEEKCVCSYELCDYAEELKNIEMHSFVKRKEVYSPIILNIDKKKYYVRIESYGHSKKSKILQGPNYLALALNKMLYDYVYVFLEDPTLAEKSLKQAIQEYQGQQIYNQALILIDTYENFFKKKLTKERKVCEEGKQQQLKEKQISQMTKNKNGQTELGQTVILVNNSTTNNKKKTKNIATKSILKQRPQQPSLTSINGDEIEEEEKEKEENNKIKNNKGKLQQNKKQQQLQKKLVKGKKSNSTKVSQQKKKVTQKKQNNTTKKGEKNTKTKNSVLLKNSKKIKKGKK